MVTCSTRRSCVKTLAEEVRTQAFKTIFLFLLRSEEGCEEAGRRVVAEAAAEKAARAARRRRRSNRRRYSLY
jgi:hypothetical protein